MAKVTFLKSPTGEPFKLAYSVGQTVDIKNADLLKALKEAGMVEKATASKAGIRDAAFKKKGETR